MIDGKEVAAFGWTNVSGAASVVRGIHCCDGPVGYADGQEEEGYDRVEESGHDVADGPGNKTDKKNLFELCLWYENGAPNSPLICRDSTEL